MKNQVQLITYVDRLGGGGIQQLQAILKDTFKGIFGGVHLLPFFTPIDGSDAGFDPVDHTQIDPRLGQWSDLQALSNDVDLMADVIVNHVSSNSRQFHDFSERGNDSPYQGLFLSLDAVFPYGACEMDLTKIYRPRPGLPFNVVTLKTGERRVLWSTFTPAQLDIDVTHPQGTAYLADILQVLSRNGVRMIRLDAVGYALKRAGTNCFLIPETFDFIDNLTERAHGLGMEVLVEVHSYFRDQIDIASRVDRVYDFALPPLVLHAFEFHSAKYLKEWITLRPKNALTVLDTHDGIGVIDIGADASDRVRRPGLVPDEQLDALIEIVHERTGGESRLATGAAASNLDIYQINTTFYDATGRNDRAYLLARALQFFLPGVPQVYYVGLLAGSNDMELLGRTRVGRDINRHFYSTNEIERALQKPVVQSLLQLIAIRNSHPSFQGEFSMSETDVSILHLRWINGRESAELRIDFENLDYQLAFSADGSVHQMLLPARD